MDTAVEKIKFSRSPWNQLSYVAKQKKIRRGSFLYYASHSFKKDSMETTGQEAERVSP